MDFSQSHSLARLSSLIKLSIVFLSHIMLLQCLYLLTTFNQRIKENYYAKHLV